MELTGRASHRDTFSGSPVTSTFVSLHILSMSQNERVGRRGQVSSSNLHNLCMVTTSSSPLPRPSATVFTAAALISVAVRANKTALQQLCYVGCQGRTHRKWWATGKLYFPFLSMSSLPTCPLAINAALSYPPHTHPHDQ